MNDITIAGCGVAGSFLALRALQLGLRPTMIRVPAPACPGVEIIPVSAGRLLEILDLGDVLARLGVGLGDGLARRGADGTVDTAPGRSLHVERLALREGVLAVAVRRGARVRDLGRLPSLDPDVVSVDASGQRAGWSQPVVRRGRISADVFAVEDSVPPGTGRIALMDRGWAYLAADQDGATVGVVGRDRRAAGGIDAETCQALGLAPSTRCRFLGRRPAFVQWAAEPALGRRLAIGDAAFHHNPIGGRGIAFALGSAFAAATTLATWRDDPASEAVARQYYKDYVAAEARRHLAFLAGEEGVPSEPAALPERIIWAMPGTVGSIAMNGRVVAGEVFALASGGHVRWAGGLDLACLRDLTVEAAPSAWVARRLGAQGYSAREAESALRWALGKGLIVASGPRDAGIPP